MPHRRAPRGAARRERTRPPLLPTCRAGAQHHPDSPPRAPPQQVQGLTKALSSLKGLQDDILQLGHGRGSSIGSGYGDFEVHLN